MTFKAGRPGVIDTIDLVTPVRKSVRHTLYVENPLAYSVTFTASCNVGEILLPGHLTVPQQSEVRIKWQANIKIRTLPYMMTF